MPRSCDSGQFDLAEHFGRLQRDLSARLHIAQQVEHASASGTAAEQHWIELLNLHLPARYRAAPAFLFNAQHRRSRQIDIAIYDHLDTLPLFRDTAALHLPIESVRAVFEVKPTFSRQWLADAALKAASVRALAPRRRILTGLLAKSSVWNPDTFRINLGKALDSTRLDLGCALDHGAFAREQRLVIAPAESSLHYFLSRLLSRLNPKLSAYFDQ